MRRGKRWWWEDQAEGAATEGGSSRGGSRVFEQSIHDHNLFLICIYSLKMFDFLVVMMC